MLETTERQTTQSPTKGRRGLVPILVIAILAVAGAATWLIMRGGEKTATDVMQDLAAAMRADDMASVAGFDADTAVEGFIEWQIGMRLDPTFSNCSEITGAGTTLVNCDVTSGDEYFYAVIAGEAMTSTASGNVNDDGVLIPSNWPPPEGLLSIDAEFRTWVRDTHPDLEDQMWGFPGNLGIKMTRESGELRTQLLDEYLASLQ